jgi:hypothetical protein
MMIQGNGALHELTASLVRSPEESGIVVGAAVMPETHLPNAFICHT